MSDENLIYIAGLVFLLMLVGLVLTAVEFRYGAPHRQEQEKKRASRRRERKPQTQEA